MPVEKRGTYLIYASDLLLALLFATLSDLVKKETARNFFLYLSVFTIGAIIAFRAQTGIDDPVYHRIFMRADGKSLIEYFSTSGVERGYLFLNYILFYLTKGNYNFTQAFLAYAGFSFFALAMKWRRGLDSTPAMVFLLWTHQYFFFLAAGLVRIYIAVAIVFFALRYVEEQRWGRYLFWILVAATIHMSSLLMLLFLIFAVKKEMLFRDWRIFIVLAAIITPIGFVLIAKVLIPFLGPRYQDYADFSKSHFSLDRLDMLPVFFIGTYFYRKIAFENRRGYIVGLILLALSVVFSASSAIVPLGRVIYYANLGVLIVIAAICKLKPRNIIDLGLQFILIVYALVYVMHTGLLATESHRLHLFPYESFLSI